MTTYSVQACGLVYANDSGKTSTCLHFKLAMDAGESIELGQNYVLCTDADFKQYKGRRDRVFASLILASATDKEFAKNRDYWKFSKDKIGACNFNENTMLLEYAVIVNEAEHEKLCAELSSANQLKTITLECDFLDAMFRGAGNKGLELTETGETKRDAVNKFSYTMQYHSKLDVIQGQALEVYKLVKWKLFAVITLLFLILVNLK